MEETSLQLCSDGQYLWLTETCEIGQMAAAALGKQQEHKLDTPNGGY